MRAAASLARGTGRTCAAKIAQAAAVADAKPEQIAKALELIEDGGAVPARTGLRVFRTVATAGDAVYLTTPTGCTCPAGCARRRCYHSAAVGLLLAS